MTRLILTLCLSLLASPAWSFPTTDVTETFTGTDGTSPPNANWTNQIGATACGLQIISNAASPVTSSTNCTAYYNVTTYTNVDAYVTWMSGGSPIIEVWCRIQSPGSGAVDGYKVQHNTGADTLKLFRVDNNTDTQLGTTDTIVLANGDSIGIECNGSTIKAFFKLAAGAWTEQESQTDATYGSAGNVGLRCSGSSGAGGTLCDGFGIGTVVAAATRRPQPAVIFP